MTPTVQTSFLSRRAALLGGAVLAGAVAAGVQQSQAQPAAPQDRFAAAVVRKLTDTQWRMRLAPASYAVLRQAATERPYTSPLNDEHRRGTFKCGGCGLALFQSDWKFDSGTGWPSYFRAYDANLVKTVDRSAGMVRTEYHCAQCLGHQGHLFEDGPAPTGLRYCNNGVALTFSPA